MASSQASLSYHAAVPLWSGSPEDDARFRRILGTTLLLCLIAGVVLPMLPRPVETSREEPLPARYAKLLLDAKPLPPPEIKHEPPRPKPPTTPVPQAAKAPIPVPEARRPEPDKSPGEKIEAARRKASGVGLLAAKDELAVLRDAPVAAQINTAIKQGPGVGSGTGPGVGSGAGPGVPVRSLITSNATGGSGGINTAGYSRDTGGGGLAGRATTMVAGVAGGGGGGGAGVESRAESVQRGSSGKASRSIEDVKLVLERNKGALYTLYNRALREDPALEGKVVIKLQIAPSGSAECEIVSSELRSPELEKKLLARLRQIDFGAKDVAPLEITWPVDFLPS